jgi:hypothetical protein
MGNKIQQLFTEEYKRISKDLSVPRYLKFVVESIVNCRTMNLGGYILFCPDYHGGHFLFNSCKTRGCPVCMESEQLKWFSNQKQILFPVKHNHLVFKIPSEITFLWLYNKYLFQTIMFDAAKYSIQKVNQELYLQPGWITVLHTSGSDLSYHPHLHTLITHGSFDDNKKWQEKGIDIDSLRKYYNKSIRKKLLKAINRYWLDIPPGADRDKIARTIQSKDFYIQQAGIYNNGEGVLKYFSKKLKAGAINHKQVISYDDTFVTFYYMQDKRKVIVKLKREEFIRRYLNHIPPNGYRIIRNYGLYSSRLKNKTKELRIQTFGEYCEEPEYTPQIPKCPVCGKELSIVKSCSAKEFKELFSSMRKTNPGRPPPEHDEFVRMNN